MALKSIKKISLHSQAWKFFLLVAIVLDLGYSAIQHQYYPMDGDFAVIAMPAHHYGVVLKDPLGTKALFHQEKYYAPNRFVPHASMYVYYQVASSLTPLLVKPLDRLYLSAAFFKIMVQVLLLFILGLYLQPFFKAKKMALLWGIFLIMPLFQTNGFNKVFGVIDPSITYTFFYAWPMALVFLFLFPFYKKMLFGAHFLKHWWSKIIWLGLAIFLPLSSPICAPGILLITGLILTYWGLKQIFSYPPKQLIGIARKQFLHLGIYPFTLLIVLLLMSVYSYYLGTFNLENNPAPMVLAKRYQLLGLGLKSMLFNKLAAPLLLLALIFNAQMIRRYFLMDDPKAERILQMIRWITVLSILYILSLPLGGYRPYRPFIIKKDVILPIILALFYAYGLSSYYLLQSLQKLRQKIYLSFLMIISLFFTFSDQIDFEANATEKKAIEILQNSNEEVVVLPKDHLLMAWHNFKDTEESVWHVKLLQRFEIIEKDLLYINAEED